MQRIRVPAVILVGCIWTLAFVTGVATDDYTALTYTMPVVLIAAAAVFALNGKKGDK